MGARATPPRRTAGASPRKPTCILLVLLAGCQPTSVATLTLPDPREAKSAILALREADRPELWALELGPTFVPFEARDSIASPIAVEALYYDVPLAELRLTAGPLATVSRGRRVPAARWIYTGAVSGEGEVGAWSLADAPSEPVASARIEGYDCPRWAARDLLGLEATPQAAVPIGGRRALVFAGGRVVLVHPDTGLTPLTDAPTAFLTSAARGVGDELWLAGGPLLRARLVDGEVPQIVDVTTVAANAGFARIGYEPTVGVVGVTWVGQVGRWREGADVELLADVGRPNGGVFGPTVLPLGAGRVAVVAPGSPRLVLVERDGVLTEDNGHGLGMAGLAELEGHGLFASGMGALLRRDEAGAWSPIPGATIAGLIYFLIPMADGLFYGGSAGLVAGYLPTVGHCPAEQVRPLDIPGAIALSDDELLLFGGELSTTPTLTLLTRIE